MAGCCGGACGFAKGVIRRFSMSDPRIASVGSPQWFSVCWSWMACISESLAGSSRAIDDHGAGASAQSFPGIVRGYLQVCVLRWGWPDQCLAELPVADDYDVNGCFLLGGGVNRVRSMKLTCGRGKGAALRIRCAKAREVIAWSAAMRCSIAVPVNQAMVDTFQADCSPAERVIRLLAARDCPAYAESPRYPFRSDGIPSGSCL